MPNQNTQQALRKEEREIMNFIFDKVRMTQEGRIFSHELFAAYKSWRLDNGLPESSLSLDGFGRLMPKSFRRKPMLKDGIIQRGLLGAEII